MQLKKRWSISENREFKNSAEAMIKNIGNFEKMLVHLLKEFQYEIDNVLNVNRFEKVNEITKPKLTIRHSEDFIKVYIDIKPLYYTRNTINILEMDLMDYSIRINQRNLNMISGYNKGVGYRPIVKIKLDSTTGLNVGDKYNYSANGVDDWRVLNISSDSTIEIIPYKIIRIVTSF